jgi:ATP-binding cassette subfamily G (WHITE) protein 2 (SNQ2)
LFRHPRAHNLSSSTRGLDSATALEFAKALRIATDISQTSTVVSIYQVADSLYELFDKVCLIYQGKMAYYGPANLARQYFIDMGYEPGNRQTTADFLVSVTDPNARIIRSGAEPTVPRTANEFFSYYQHSNISQINRDDIESYRREFIDTPKGATEYMASFQAEHATTMSKKSPYLISIPMQIKAVMTRRFQILKGGIAAEVTNALCVYFKLLFNRISSSH